MNIIQEKFNRRASSYDNPLTAFIGERELRQVRLFVPSGARVLDYGCGTGRTSLDLLRRGCRVTAYDISAEMLALAARKAQQAGFSREQAEFISDETIFPNSQWPVVTLIGVLDYYPDPQPLLRRVSKFLAPGGQLVVTFPNALSPLACLYVLGSRFTVPAVARTPSFCRKSIREAGLRVLEERYAFPAVAPLGHTLIYQLERA